VFSSEELSNDLDSEGDHYPRRRSKEAVRVTRQGSSSGAGGGNALHNSTDRPYLVEANLASNEDHTGPFPILVKAHPFWQKRQLAIMTLVEVTMNDILALLRLL
jgi:hypothetical protein